MQRLVELKKAANGNLFMALRVELSRNATGHKRKRVTGAKFVGKKENEVFSSSLSMSEWDIDSCPLEFLKIPGAANAYTYSETRERINEYASNFHYSFNFYRIPERYVRAFFDSWEKDPEWICGNNIRRGSDDNHDGIKHKIFLE